MMDAAVVIEGRISAETISVMLDELKTRTAGSQALFAKNERIDEMLQARKAGDLELAARYKRNNDLGNEMVAEGTDLETRISLTAGQSPEDIKAKLEAARIIYAYGPFADPIAALLHDTDFEPSSVSLASILIDALRLLGIEAGDIMEMKARHEAYQRRKV